ncbi:hypothetical protein O0L34_g3453 [Tuta absoluta]|nr:hypothetical protein O0L34_g3453 [Tuta absoluta]
MLKESKTANRQKITEVSKNINKQIRKDRKEKRTSTLKHYIEKTGGTKKATKQLNDKKSWMPNMKSQEGNKTSKRPEILQIATDFYKNLYHSGITNSALKEVRIQETVPPIILGETIRAINTQKFDKAPGSDQITNELLKSTLPIMGPKLTEIFNEVLTTESIPKDWTNSTIILLHKKGDKGDIGNYRPISLMSNVYKVFSKIILSRISGTLDDNQPREQAGFRSNFSTIDHIHVLRQVLQKYNEYNKKYYLAFVDFNKAFDSLEHDYIWDALKRQGVQEKYICLLKNIYSQSTAQVKLETIGEKFPIQRGVRQGDPISPKLFTAVLEMIHRNLDWSHFGININGENLSHIRFADDLVLFSECPKQLEEMLQQLSDESAKAGLSMNTTKTKTMTNALEYIIKINNRGIEYVREYVYLGQLISTRDCMEKELDRRIANTWKRYWSLSEVMKNKDMPIAHKRKVYDTCILPCLTYGCQTWALTEEQNYKIKVCQNSIERSVIGVKRRDKVRLTDIKKTTKFKKVDSVYKQLKWRWTGHMLREPKEKWSKIITEWYPRGCKRSRGRPTKRWEDDLKKVAGPAWIHTAKDRSKWKSLEEAYVERQAIK